MNSICGVLAIHSKEAAELRNTFDLELDLQHAAFMSYALDKVYEFVESITREGNFVVLAIHSKDASGPKEHARHGIGPLDPRSL